MNILEIMRQEAVKIERAHGTQHEWFDHRLHIFDAEKWWVPFWTMSADNVLRALPINGKLLELCAGDCFYDY